MKDIDNSILKGTPKLKILQIWVKIPANSFIKTSKNILELKSKKLPGKLSVARKSECAP